jgi:hypothetical protein
MIPHAAENWIWTCAKTVNFNGFKLPYNSNIRQLKTVENVSVRLNTYISR